jgi:hypothetical protein
MNLAVNYKYVESCSLGNFKKQDTAQGSAIARSVNIFMDGFQ